MIHQAMPPGIAQGEDVVANLDSISLFSNCGAGDVGFARAGFRFRVLAEIDERRLDVALRILSWRG